MWVIVAGLGGALVAICYLLLLYGLTSFGPPWLKLTLAIAYLVLATPLVFIGGAVISGKARRAFMRYLLR